MLTPRVMLDFVTDEPFRPFRIRMATGQVFYILYPEMIGVGRTRLSVYTVGDFDKIEKWRDAPLMMIEAIEPLDTPVPGQPMSGNPEWRRPMT